MCTKCDRQAGVPPAHRHDKDADGVVEPCDHGSYYANCPHCAFYCARCCMRVIKGGHQDDYRNYDGKRKTTVEENHGGFFESDYALKYGFGQVYAPPGRDVKYKTMYKHLVKKQLVFRFETHCLVTPAFRINTENGEITLSQTRYWDPATAVLSDWQLYGGNLYIYLK